MPSTHQAIADPRNEDILIYVDGEYAGRYEAKISVFDSAFLVGDGIWEGIRLHHGQLAFLNRHLDRLISASERTGIVLGMDRQGLSDLLYSVLDRNGMTDGVHVRLMVSRGRKKTPSQHPSNLVSGPTVVIIPEYKQADPSVAHSGVTLFTSSVRRPPPNTLDQRINCHSKLHEVMALIEAVDVGCDEALMLDVNGHVATCNATNFFAVSDGQVWTSTGEYCLPGITRGVVIEACENAEIPIQVADFDLALVHGADEAFVTGTFGGITPVRSVDGHEFGRGRIGPITARISELYESAVADDVAKRGAHAGGDR